MKLSKKIVIIFSLVLLLAVPFGNSAVQAAPDYKISGWQYHSTVKSSTTVERIAVLGATLIVSNYIPVPWKKAKSLVQFAAGTYAITRGQNLWTTHNNYRKYAEIGKPLKPIAAEQTRTTYYIDFARTKKAGSQTLTYYTSWYY